MCATTKRAVCVNHAPPRVAFEQRARAVGGLRQSLASGGAKCFCGDDGFAFGEVRREAGELEVATLGARLAGAFQWSLCQVCIHRTDFAEGAL